MSGTGVLCLNPYVLFSACRGTTPVSVGSYCWVIQTLPALIFFFMFLLLCVYAILYFCYPYFCCPYFQFASMQAFLFILIFLVILTGRFPAAVSIKPYWNRTLPVNAATGSLGKPAAISWYDNSHLMRWSSVKSLDQADKVNRIRCLLLCMSLPGILLDPV